MATKAQLQDLVNSYQKSASKYHEMYLQEKNRADALQDAVEIKFEELESYPKNDYGSVVYNRNHKRRDVVEQVFQQIIAWAGRNMGYAHNEDEMMASDEREATGLAGLVYLETVNPDWAIRFAAEVCEQNNYHGECAMLMGLYDRVTQPYLNSRHEATTVSWWAD